MKLLDITETFEQDFKDPEFIRIYLQEALNDGLPNFLVALRYVVQANDGMTPIASDVVTEHESLYQLLSENDSLQFETVGQILSSLGMKFSIVLADGIAEANV